MAALTWRRRWPSRCLAGADALLLDEAGEARVCAIDPRDSFIVHDDTVERRAILASGREAGGRFWQITLYLKDRGGGGRRAAPKAPPRVYWHFGRPHDRIPGTPGRRGFEDVLALVDAYDLLQSDR